MENTLTERRQLSPLDTSGESGEVRRPRGSFASFSGMMVGHNEVQRRPEEGSTKLVRKRANLEVGCVSQEGVYHDNEDRMAFGTNLNAEIDGFVGVFDGHGGEECAHYVSKHLSRYVRRTFCAESDWRGGDVKLHEMFHKIENDFTSIAAEEDNTSGSCATVCVVKGNEAWVANIGDCKAVAVIDLDDRSPSNYKVLTGDHRADHPLESKRINKAGGSVIGGRVHNLQPSRSFGDIDVKEIVGEGVVIPTPEVSKVTMKPGGFLIVATDGLWDSVQTDIAVEVAKNSMKKHCYDAASVADDLVDLAVNAKATDDVTVAVVVWIPEDQLISDSEE